jgi:hypothetical protein
MLPESILVVVLKNEGHAMFSGKGEASPDGLGGKINAFFPGNLRAALAA